MGARLTLVIMFGAWSLGAMPAYAQSLASQNTAPIYTWQTEVKKNKAGSFEFCLVRNMLDNGLLLQLAGNAQNQKTLALKFAENKLQRHEKYPLVWQVDNGQKQAVVARAASSQTLNLALNDDQLNALANGQNLSLRGPTDRLDIELAGGQGAVLALQDCLQVHGGVSLPAAVPPATADNTLDNRVDDGGLPPIPVAPTPQLAATIMQRFGGAGLAPTQIMVVPPAQRHKLPLDYAWDVDNLFVGYKAVDGTLANFAPFMQHYLQGLKVLCAGQIRAEMGASNTNQKAKTTYQAVDVACNHQGQITVTALLFEHSLGQQHVFFIEAPIGKKPAQGATALKARNLLVMSLQ